MQILCIHQFNIAKPFSDIDMGRHWVIGNNFLPDGTARQVGFMVLYPLVKAQSHVYIRAQISTFPSEKQADCQYLYRKSQTNSKIRQRLCEPPWWPSFSVPDSLNSFLLINCTSCTCTSKWTNRIRPKCKYQSPHFHVSVRKTCRLPISLPQVSNQLQNSATIVWTAMFFRQL